MEIIQNLTLPTHVAIIMDGNGRWARKRHLPRVEGHIHGMESVRDVVTTSCELHIPYLTLYAFSKENWVRPTKEVKKLLELLTLYLDQELPLMMEKGIRFNVIGAIEDFPKKIQARINYTLEQTRKNTNLILSIALSYGGRQEILHAVKHLIQDVRKGRIQRITEKTFKKYLYTGNIPDPDLLIRTSGEMRLSNFLLWQIAYTELYVTDILWPDFRKDAYIEALKAFSKRERRFGRVQEE